MAKLTAQEKADRARDRMIEKAREFQIGTYLNRYVASVFQKMIRAEAAAQPRGCYPSFAYNQMASVYRNLGQCVCITCGLVAPWKGNTAGGGAIETGHFIASRRASIVLEETNAHPQCVACNRHKGGNQGVYEQYMLHVYGQDEIDRLRRLKNVTKQFTREELVDLKISFTARLKAATERMGEA